MAYPFGQVPSLRFAGSAKESVPSAQSIGYIDASFSPLQEYHDAAGCVPHSEQSDNENPIPVRNQVAIPSHAKAAARQAISGDMEDLVCGAVRRGTCE